MFVPRLVPPGHYAAYLEAAKAGRTDAAIDAVMDLAARGYTPDDIIRDILAPAQEDIGALWASARIGISAEHRATVIAETALDTMLHTRFTPQSDPVGDVLLCAAEGEWHSIAARMVALVWRHLGWRVELVVPSAPADSLIDVIGERRTELVGVSCILPSNLYGAWRVLSVLRQRGCSTVVGGRGFATGSGSAQRAALLGADAYAADAVGGAEELGRLARLPPPGPRPAVDLGSAAVDADRLNADRWSVLANCLALLEGSRPDLMSEGPERIHLAEDLELALRALTSAVLVGDAAIMAQHLQWYASVMSAAGNDAGLSGLLVDVMARSLPLADHRSARAVLAAARPT